MPCTSAAGTAAFLYSRAETRHPVPELFYDRGNHYEFLSLVQELANPGELRTAQAFDFEFKNVEKQYESYHGINVKLRCGRDARLAINRMEPRCVPEPALDSGTVQLT